MPTAHDDAAYLRGRQYRDSRCLGARVELHRRCGTNPYGWHRFLMDHVAPAAGELVLEVGCGPGTLWAQAAPPTGCRLVLADLSRGMAAEARAAVPVARGLVADARALPLADRTVDLLVASFVLHHVPDVPRALREFRRVLRPTGRAVLATFGGGHLRELHDLARRVDPSLTLARDEPPANFRLERCAKLLGEVFAQVTRHDYADSLVVDDAALTAAYLLSSDSAGDEDPRYPAILAAVARELRSGPLRVAKETGLFVVRPT